MHLKKFKNHIVPIGQFPIENIHREIHSLGKYFKPDQWIDLKIAKNRISLSFRINGRLFQSEMSYENSIGQAIHQACQELKPQIEDHYEHDFLYGHPASKIISQERAAEKPLSEDEAVLQMELFKKPFLMFFNTDTQSFCTLYKEKGEYHLITSQTNRLAS